jgi:hypothetical protein
MLPSKYHIWFSIIYYTILVYSTDVFSHMCYYTYILTYIVLYTHLKIRYCVCTVVSVFEYPRIFQKRIKSNKHRPYDIYLYVCTHCVHCCLFDNRH